MNEKDQECLASQVEALRKGKIQSAEEFAEVLGPLMMALATLIAETRVTLAEINTTSQEIGQQFIQQIEAAKNSWIEAAQEAQKAADNLKQATKDATSTAKINAFMA